MTLAEKVLPSQLKPFAHDLLQDPRTLWSIEVVNGQETLVWPEMETDRQIFTQLFELINDRQDMPDADFVLTVVPKIEVIVNRSPIFQRLQYRDIKVTQGHLGTTPYFHTLEVLKALNTSTVEPQVRTILRIVALYHDVGKAISAGIGKDIKMMMDRRQQSKHSHPNHAEISALVMTALTSNPQIHDQIQALGPRAPQLLEDLILNHHLFEDIQEIVPLEADMPVEKVEAWESLKKTFSEYNVEQWTLITLIFLLARADIASNANYHQHWRKKNLMMSQLLMTVWAQLPNQLQAAAIEELRLPLNLKTAKPIASHDEWPSTPLISLDKDQLKAQRNLAAAQKAEPIII